MDRLATPQSLDLRPGRSPVAWLLVCVYAFAAAGCARGPGGAWTWNGSSEAVKLPSLAWLTGGAKEVEAAKGDAGGRRANGPAIGVPGPADSKSNLVAGRAKVWPDQSSRSRGSMTHQTTRDTSMPAGGSFAASSRRGATGASDQQQRYAPTTARPGDDALASWLRRRFGPEAGTEPVNPFLAEQPPTARRAPYTGELADRRSPAGGDRRSGAMARPGERPQPGRDVVQTSLPRTGIRDADRADSAEGDQAVERLRRTLAEDQRRLDGRQNGGISRAADRQLDDDLKSFERDAWPSSSGSVARSHRSGVRFDKAGTGFAESGSNARRAESAPPFPAAFANRNNRGSTAAYQKSLRSRAMSERSGFYPQARIGQRSSSASLNPEVELIDRVDRSQTRGFSERVAGYEHRGRPVGGHSTPERVARSDSSSRRHTSRSSQTQRAPTDDAISIRPGPVRTRSSGSRLSVVAHESQPGMIVDSDELPPRYPARFDETSDDDHYIEIVPHSSSSRP